MGFPFFPPLLAQFLDRLLPEVGLLLWTRGGEVLPFPGEGRWEGPGSPTSL